MGAVRRRIASQLVYLATNAWLSISGTLNVRLEQFAILAKSNPAIKELTWPGTGLVFTFTGMSASIALAQVSNTSSVDLIIDGGEPRVISNVADTSISTPTGLNQGTQLSSYANVRRPVPAQSWLAMSLPMAL